MNFKEIKPEELMMNPFSKIGKEWMLITAGDENGHNTMTASWGGLGVIWNKNAATAYIRQTRYTKEFVDANQYFTLSFYGPQHRQALNICGTLSGRDTDKEAKAGLTPYYVDGTTAFEEADLIFVCKKLYHQFMPPENFDTPGIDEKNYSDHDYHSMYIGEIVRILQKED